MDKKLYKDTMDSIRISDEAVENAINNLKQPDAIGKVIEMKNTKHRFIKPISAVAAALALIICAGAIFNLGSMPEQGTGNSFFITANAAATDDEAVKITKEFTAIGTVSPRVSSYERTIHNWGDPEIISDLNVEARFNFSCVGDNIETITYKVNNGDTDGVICLYDNNTKIVDYGTRNRWFNGESESRIKNGVKSKIYYYDYVTVDYDSQLDLNSDWSRFAVYYNPKSDEEKRITNRFLEDFDSFSTNARSMSLKEAKKGIKDFYENVFRDTEIVITATYTDGSKETQTLKLDVDNVIVYDSEYKKFTDESRLYKNIFNYELVMSAKLV